MESRESKKAFDRYQLIVELLEKGNDAKGLDLVDELVEKCANYVETVMRVETLGKLQRFRKDEAEFTEELERLDKLRRITHEALIAQLTIVNRYLFRNEALEGKVPPGGIYSLDPSSIRSRIAVGD